MGRCIPKAYCPEQGYRYQIFCRQRNTREWEHCDYAVDTKEKEYLLREYTLAYQGAYEFLTVQVPQKYWKKETDMDVDI